MYGIMFGALDDSQKEQSLRNGNRIFDRHTDQDWCWGVGGGGFGAGMLVVLTGQRSATEHKSLRSPVRKPVARLRPKNHFATLPITQVLQASI